MFKFSWYQQLTTTLRLPVLLGERSSLFAYLMLVLLQLKVVWGMWLYKDLTFGDTSSYFAAAHNWFENFLVNILWSPLYTAYYGSLLFFSSDVYLVTILHRLIIIFTATLLVLAILRRLLPPGLAWLAAAWWVILPINFNTMYEVHLFAILPVLAAWLLILALPSRWGRGGTVAILFGAAFLVRNELIVAVVLLAGICLWWEIRLAHQTGTATLRAYLTSYGLPLLLAGLLVIFFYTRSIVQFPQLPAAAEPKHTLNMCQVYAFGYQQRHPEWTKSPWTECYELMESHFGERLPSLTTMWHRNPRAVLTHFGWNISLIPNGLQVLLFNATSGVVNPDYAPVQTNSMLALILSLLVGGIIAAGLVMLYRERSYWWQTWLQERALGWLAMLAVVAVTLLVIPTQRPRPSYLFSLSIFLMALTGMSLFAVAHRWPVFQRLSRWLPALMVALVLVIPGYYPAHASPRPLLTVYRQLDPFTEIIARPDTKFLKGEYAWEIQNYFSNPQVFSYNLLTERPTDTTVGIFLESRGINLLYVDKIFSAQFSIDPFSPSFLNSMQTAGWKLIGLQDEVGEHWMLFYKPTQPVAPVKKASLDIVSSTGTAIPASLALGQNWYSFETFNGETFRWVNNDAEIVITATSVISPHLNLEVEPGPGLASQPFTLYLQDGNGQTITQVGVNGRQTVQLALPELALDHPHLFRLHIDGGGLPTLNDPRLLNFRVFWINLAKP